MVRQNAGEQSWKAAAIGYVGQVSPISHIFRNRREMPIKAVFDLCAKALLAGYVCHFEYPPAPQRLQHHLRP